MSDKNKELKQLIHDVKNLLLKDIKRTFNEDIFSSMEKNDEERMVMSAYAMASLSKAIDSISDIYSTEDVAKILGYTNKDTVRQVLKRKGLGIRIGRFWVIRQNELDILKRGGYGGKLLVDNGNKQA